MGPKILIVEDDAGVRGLLLDRLEAYDLAFAVCQSDAYERLKSGTFDLVLLDLRLPRRPDDMKPANEVGIDILRRIRERGLQRRGCTTPLPVVVMTAHGSESISVEVLVDNGANNYVQKPFGEGRALEERIEKALNGEGALLPVGSGGGRRIRLALDSVSAQVQIETLRYSGAPYELLRVLGDLFIEDQRALRDPQNYTGIVAQRLAVALGTSDQAVRRRVSKLRKKLSADFRDQLGRSIDDCDIIYNPRDWKGYRLNPRVVLVAWDQMPDSGF